MSEKQTKVRFLDPTISKITPAKEKDRRKRKSEEEEGRRREKKKRTVVKCAPTLIERLTFRKDSRLRQTAKANFYHTV